MTSDSLEARVSTLVRKHHGFYLFGKPELTEQTDLDVDLQLDDDDALELMEDFFTTFRVARGNFSITTYYPPDPPLSVRCPNESNERRDAVSVSACQRVSDQGDDDDR
ncbi:DUF1493 family protein [Cronobacter muytjensii]|uniref:DUF1493 family protein n=1 Tax=Cronobacter muytjensii TaxID=413501 RepID=UPI0003AA57CB|nr:DUF1493 family protein [Cronobacter muytjensii]